MPLKYRKEPDKVKKVVKDQLSKMASQKAFRTEGLAKVSLAGGVPEPALDQVIPVYYLGLGALKRNEGISSAVQKSWRYLVYDGDEVVATADSIMGEDGEPVFSHLNEGPLVAGVIHALNKADSLSELEVCDFEVRLLMVPALYVAALWFVASDGGQDYVMPVEPTSTPLEANELVSVHTMIEVLQSLAKEPNLDELT